MASPVAFGPPGDPDVTKALDFGVTRLFGRLYFSLDPSDQIVLTDSCNRFCRRPRAADPNPYTDSDPSAYTETVNYMVRH